MVFNKRYKFQYWISVQSQFKKTTIYNLIFLIALYSLKNDNKQPSETRN